MRVGGGVCERVRVGVRVGGLLKDLDFVSNSDRVGVRIVGGGGGPSDEAGVVLGAELIGAVVSVTAAAVGVVVAIEKLPVIKATVWGTSGIAVVAVEGAGDTTVVAAAVAVGLAVVVSAA